jgi:hypothetical protein
VSQYPYPPSPYQTPGIPYGNWTPARPASTRKATIWQCVLAAVLLLEGSVICATAWATSNQDVQQEIDAMGQQFRQLNLPTYSVQVVRVGQTVEGGFLVLLGAVVLILALFVGRGGRVAMVISMVVMAVIGVVAALFGAVSVVLVFADPIGGLAMVIFSAFWLTICVIPFMMLWKARRNTSQSAMAVSMQQMQYWMMMQQQQAAAAGYGYGQPQYGGAGYGLGYGQTTPQPGMQPPGLPQPGGMQQMPPPGPNVTYSNPAPTPPNPPQAPQPPANPPAA